MHYLCTSYRYLVEFYQRNMQSDISYTARRPPTFIVSNVNLDKQLCTRRITRKSQRLVFSDVWRGRNYSVVFGVQERLTLYGEQWNPLIKMPRGVTWTFTYLGGYCVILGGYCIVPQFSKFIRNFHVPKLSAKMFWWDPKILDKNLATEHIST